MECDKLDNFKLLTSIEYLLLKDFEIQRKCNENGFLTHIESLYNSFIILRKLTLNRDYFERNELFQVLEDRNIDEESRNILNEFEKYYRPTKCPKEKVTLLELFNSLNLKEILESQKKNYLDLPKVEVNLKNNFIQYKDPIFIIFLENILNSKFNISFYQKFSNQIKKYFHEIINLLMKFGINTKEKIIKDLISKFEIGENQFYKDSEGRNNSIIHSLISNSHQFNEISKIIDLFISQYHIDADTPNDDGKYPLDLVIENPKNDYLLFKLLINHGGGKNSLLQEEYSNYYHSLKENIKEELSKEIKLLTKMNPLLTMKLAINHFFPLKKEKTDGNLVYIVHGEKRYIKENFWKLIYKNDDSNPNKFVTFKEFGLKLHIELEPKIPGYTYMISSLAFNFLNLRLAQNEMATISKNENSMGMPILIYQGIKGVQLNNSNILNYISKSNPDNKNKLLLLELLINNADGYLSNYYAVKTLKRKGKYEYKILPSYNKSSFLITKSNKNIIQQINSCLLLLQEMNNYVILEIVHCFTKDIIGKINKWFNLIKEKNSQWNSLKQNIDKNCPINSILNIPFPKESAKFLFNKIFVIHNLLYEKTQGHYHITLSMLFKALEPELYDFFETKKKLKSNNYDDALITQATITDGFNNLSSLNNIILKDLLQKNKILNDTSKLKYEKLNYESLIFDSSEIDSLNNVLNSTQDWINQNKKNYHGPHKIGFSTTLFNKLLNECSLSFFEYLTKIFNLKDLIDPTIQYRIKEKIHNEKNFLKTLNLHGFNQFENISFLDIIKLTIEDCGNLNLLTKTLIFKMIFGNGYVDLPSIELLEVLNCVGLESININVGNEFKYFFISNCKELKSIKIQKTISNFDEYSNEINLKVLILNNCLNEKNIAKLMKFIDSINIEKVFINDSYPIEKYIYNFNFKKKKIVNINGKELIIDTHENNLVGETNQGIIGNIN